MPDAKTWSPDAPNLYRCRVSIAGSDARDALFGCRSFQLARGRKDMSDGGFLLNGKPVFLRGVNIQGFNLYSYWGEKDRLQNALLLLKAANFNAVRSCQHVEFPEVRELLDRFGIMSEQDMGGGRTINRLSNAQYIHTENPLDGGEPPVIVRHSGRVGFRPESADGETIRRWQHAFHDSLTANRIREGSAEKTLIGGTDLADV